jgi:hypothetical protein
MAGQLLLAGLIALKGYIALHPKIVWESEY